MVYVMEVFPRIVNTFFFEKKPAFFEALQNFVKTPRILFRIILGQEIKWYK